MVKRYSVYMVETVGQIVKPCVVISPDELNATLPYVMIAPITSKVRYYPFRVNMTLKDKEGQIALDQIHTVGKESLVKKLGRLPEESHQKISHILKEMFE